MEYPSITDTKERIIRFKVIVNEEAKAGETILNKAKVDDTVNPPEEPGCRKYQSKRRQINSNKNR